MPLKKLKKIELTIHNPKIINFVNKYLLISNYNLL